MAMFQDNMDFSRVVKPLRTQGKSSICEIFWKNGDKLDFGGIAPIPTSLFEGGRCGFTAYTTATKAATDTNEEVV